MPVAAILLSVALLAPQQDSVRVGASLSADRIAVGEATVLRITVETRGPAPAEIRVPPLPGGLEPAGTSDFSQTQISVPGGRSRATRREITIIARRPGVYRIGAASVVVEGRTYRTPALDLVVRDGPVSARPGSASRGQGTVLRLSATPDTVFVGQQVLLHADAVFAEDARTRQARPPVFDPPAPSGFWVQDVPEPVSVTLRVREGRTVETQTFRRVLFPLQPGEYAIPPARLHYEVRRGFLLAPETREVVSDSVRLTVLPLPPEDRPASFHGAVGRLSMRAWASPERIALGEETVLTVELEGLGHIKALPEPRLDAPPGVDVLAPAQESTVEFEQGLVGGSKRFRWVLVPRDPGIVVLPPMEYAVFDPDLRRYVVLTTDTLRIEATPLAAAPPPDTALRPVRPGPGRERAGWARTTGFAALQALPLIIVAAVISVRRGRARPPGPREHHRRIRAEFEALARDPATGRRVAAMGRLLGGAVPLLLGAEHGHSPSEPVELLMAHGRAEDAETLRILLADIDRHRFAPARHAEEADLITARVRAFLDRLAPRRRGLPWTRVGVVALLVGAAGAAAAHATRPASAFDDALARYAARDYAGAAARFHDHARTNPRDPAAWYNLGSSAYRAGDPGRAVWAWLRAARLAPRDEDIRHNLRIANATGALRAVLPPDRLAPAERLVVMAAAWWVLVLAFLARRRRRLARSVQVAAVVVLAGLGTAMASRWAGPLVVTPVHATAGLYAGPSVHDELMADFTVGSAARVLERRGDWFLVRLESGSAGILDGWVPRAMVAAP
ncbi:MAG TPA: BatD family protein [Longimicrobiales bacterium]|nr:BatD family protein [Longimicrobiales bacterium]